MPDPAPKPVLRVTVSIDNGTRTVAWNTRDHDLDAVIGEHADEYLKQIVAGLHQAIHQVLTPS